MAVAVLVVAADDFGHGRAHPVQPPVFGGQPGHVFHQVQHGAGVAVGHAGQEVQHVVSQRGFLRSAAPAAEFHQFFAAQRAQPHDV